MLIKDMKKAIVISAGPLGLGIIRSLGKEGIKSIVIYENDYEAGIYSKYCVEKARVKSYLEKENILNILLENKDKWKGLLIIPGNDESLGALSYYKKELQEHFIIYVPDFETVKKIINKKEMLTLAKEMNMPMPKSYFPESMEDLEKIKTEISYPCLMKPLERHFFYAVFRTKLFRIKNYEELKEKFELCLKNKLEVSLAELIPGKDTNFYSFECYVTKAGEITNEFVKVKFRQTPPFFGVGRVSMSTEKKEIIPLAKEFLSKLKDFSGPAYIEFKFDERDGLYKFIEINGRIIISVSLSTRCGINFPHILYSEFVDSKIIKTNNYEKNIYWIQLYRDIATTLSKAAKEEKLGFKEFIRPYLGKKVFAYESMDDPMPMIMDWKFNLRSIFPKIIKNLKTEE